jgi:cation diffusion facilitator CzcD-associated flavoprotein CzcO
VTGDPPHRVVVIGAGFAGISMGVALRNEPSASSGCGG